MFIFRTIRLSFNKYAFWLLILLGTYLRLYKADEFPIYQNDDGLFYVWAGNSVLDDLKHPTSLTIFESNTNALVWRSQVNNHVPHERFGYRLSDPWFDAPLLGTILIALPARLVGYTEFGQIPHILVRSSALLASVTSLVLVYWLALRLWDQKVAYFSLSVFTVWPLAVFSSRQSYLENIMIPFALFGALVLWNNRGKWQGWLLGLVSSACILIKFSGVMVALWVGYWLYKQGQKVPIKQAITILTISLLLYTAYGLWSGGETFLRTLSKQSGRGMHVGSWTYLVMKPEVQGVIDDGWWILSLFASVWLITKRNDKRSKFISSFIFSWWLIVFLMSGIENTSPWYKNVALPFMAIALGRFLAFWWETRNAYITLLILLFGLTGWSLAGYTIPSIYLRLGTLLLISVVGVYIVNDKRKEIYLAKKLIMLLVFLLSMIGNIQAVRLYPALKCADGTCINPEKIVLPSNLH